MSDKSVNDLTNEVSDLRSKLASAERELEDAMKSRRDNPAEYIGKLIYANKVSNGSYGYEYGNFGDTEITRAQEVIDAAGGDLLIAERFVTQFHIR